MPFKSKEGVETGLVIAVERRQLVFNPRELHFLRFPGDERSVFAKVGLVAQKDLVERVRMVHSQVDGKPTAIALFSSFDLEIFSLLAQTGCAAQEVVDRRDILHHHPGMNLAQFGQRIRARLYNGRRAGFVHCPGHACDVVGGIHIRSDDYPPLFQRASKHLLESQPFSLHHSYYFPNRQSVRRH